MTEISTEEILELIRNSDKGVWDIIYRKHGKMLKKFVLNNSGNEEDANDILQETMVAAYVNMQKLDFKLTCNVGTYLFSILRFKWLAELKRRGSKKTLALDNKEYIIPYNTTEFGAIEKEELFSSGWCSTPHSHNVCT